MHPAQKGCSQPLTMAACSGWMLPWQMAHMTPSSSLPSSDALSAAADAAAAAAAAADAAAAVTAAAASSSAAATATATASSSSAAAALEAPPAEERVALGSRSSSWWAWNAGKRWSGMLRAASSGFHARSERWRSGTGTGPERGLCAPSDEGSTEGVALRTGDMAAA